MNDAPDEPEHGEPGPPEGGAGDESDAPLRGWIDPDDRLWRHPSEVVPPSPGRETVHLNVPPRHPYRGAVMLLVGAAAVMAAVAWVVVLLSPASQRPLASATHDGGVSLTTLAGAANAVPAVAAAAGRSMVELEATTPRGTIRLIGVAVAEGGLVATTADPLSGVTRLDLVAPGGRLLRASVVATDHASDVALVTVPRDVPVAPFADDASLDGGTPVMTLSFVPAGNDLALHVTTGTVNEVATPIEGGPANGMAAITTSPAVTSAVTGDPLLNANGDVVGILCAPGASPVVYLPTQLVIGVADDLRSSNHVVHGWLGVKGNDVAGGNGAMVDVVQAGGPAAGHLQVGQVITAVNAMPVRTWAELRARLYVMAPGAAVAVSVQGTSGAKVLNLTLSGSS